MIRAAALIMGGNIDCRSGARRAEIAAACRLQRGANAPRLQVRRRTSRDQRSDHDRADAEQHERRKDRLHSMAFKELLFDGAVRRHSILARGSLHTLAPSENISFGRENERRGLTGNPQVAY